MDVRIVRSTGKLLLASGFLHCLKIRKTTFQTSFIIIKIRYFNARLAPCLALPIQHIALSNFNCYDKKIVNNSVQIHHLFEERVASHTFPNFHKTLLSVKLSTAKQSTRF